MTTLAVRMSVQRLCEEWSFWVMTKTEMLMCLGEDRDRISRLCAGNEPTIGKRGCDLGKLGLRSRANGNKATITRDQKNGLVIDVVLTAIRRASFSSKRSRRSSRLAFRPALLGFANGVCRKET
jgi:hypothetical protein